MQTPTPLRVKVENGEYSPIWQNSNLNAQNNRLDFSSQNYEFQQGNNPQGKDQSKYVSTDFVLI